MVAPEKGYHNDTSDKYVAKRIERELQQLEHDFAEEELAQNQNTQDDQHQKAKSHLLNSEQFFKVLSNMGFLPYGRQLDALDQ
jgi:uncharacterized protein YdaU (DUF1376 family)